MFWVAFDPRNCQKFVLPFKITKVDESILFKQRVCESVCMCVYSLILWCITPALRHCAWSFSMFSDILLGQRDFFQNSIQNFFKLNFKRFLLDFCTSYIFLPFTSLFLNITFFPHLQNRTKSAVSYKVYLKTAIKLTNF